MAPKTVIEGSSFSASQLKELFDQVANGTLNGAHLQAFIEHRNPFEVGGEEKLFNPHTYFKTREGLYVWNTFEQRILSEQKVSMPHRGLEGVTSHTLARNMTDTEIIDELLGGTEEVRKHASTLDQIATMIDLQPKGIDGELLNNGYANIFYVLVNGVLFAVSVGWRLGRRRWRVGAWHLGAYGNWDAGIRVFRNTTLVI
ncbi:MAG: hypothetical protein WAV98_00135 [Minisyncoccia bacterium]